MSKAYFSFKEKEIWSLDELAVSWMKAMCQRFENRPEEWLNELNDFWKIQVKWLGVSNVIGTALDEYITDKKKKEIFFSLVNQLAKDIGNEGNIADKQMIKKNDIFTVCAQVTELLNTDGT